MSNAGGLGKRNWIRRSVIVRHPFAALRAGMTPAARAEAASQAMQLDQEMNLSQPIAFDRRFTPARPDLAAAHLRGHVEATIFVEGREMQIVAPVADVRSGPTPDASLDTQALRGERVTVYEEHEGWAWCQLQRDSYVGYLPAHMLGPMSKAPTHRVSALRTFVYPAANMKVPPLEALPLGAEIRVEGEGDYVRIVASAADHTIRIRFRRRRRAVSRRALPLGR
jgi:hypothetical protein